MAERVGRPSGGQGLAKLQAVQKTRPPAWSRFILQMAAPHLFPPKTPWAIPCLRGKPSCRDSSSSLFLREEHLWRGCGGYSVGHSAWGRGGGGGGKEKVDEMQAKRHPSMEQPPLRPPLSFQTGKAHCLFFSIFHLSFRSSSGCPCPASPHHRLVRKVGMREGDLGRGLPFLDQHPCGCTFPSLGPQRGGSWLPHHLTLDQ